MPHTRFHAMVTPPDTAANAEALWLVVERGTVLVVAGDRGLELPRARAASELGIIADHEHFLGFLDGVPVWAAGLDTPGSVHDLRPENLFTLFAHLDEPTWALAGRAVQVVEWHRTHQFCGRCGERTVPSQGERARKCPSCGLLSFPRLAPAVITLIEREGEALLARGRTFGPNPMYSALAGFVEPGETIEEAVAREVREEVGVEVDDVRYFGSQPWPFPHSLMLGFQARWAGGDIKLDESEIVDAQWFRPDALPNLPGRLSIARWLIDDWLRRQGVLEG